MSCSHKVVPTGEADKLVIYPSPPDTARIQYLTKFSSSLDIIDKRNFITRFFLGEKETVNINKPYGIAVAKGKAFICDTYIKGLDIINFQNNTFEQFIPQGKGELKVPINCFVDSKGYIYIADSERKQIVIFDQNEKYVNCIGGKEDFKPVDVFVQDNKIWVTNLPGHQINVYKNDSSYQLIQSFPEVNHNNTGNLFSPTNIFVTPDKVYVTDFGDFKVKIYDHQGKFIDSVGSYGSSVGQLARPKGIAVDKESNLFVVDAGFENTQIFNREGKLLLFFGGSYKKPGDMWLPAKVTLDYENLDFFRKYVDPSYNLKYLIFVTNQFGPDKISVYGAIEPAHSGENKGEKTGNKK